MFEQQLLKRKITTKRFRLPWSYETSVDAITAAYKANVQYRHRCYQDDLATQNHIKAAARWLTADNPKFGMLLCGRCGNGKTTLSNAIHDLVSWIYRDDDSASYKYIKQVERLELSMGSLTDKGGQLLLDKLPEFPNVKELDLHYHYLSDEMMEKLEQLPIEVDIDEQNEPDEWDDEIYYYPMLTE